MAVRTIACLPALVGAWRDPAGGALLSSSGTYPVNHAALERPDLIRNSPRTINMSHDRRRAARRRRPADPRALRLQLESGRGRARFGQGRRRLRARRSVHRRPRRVPDRHRRLRRHRAAGDDAARARSTSTRPTATCTRRPTTPPSRRWARRKPQHRGLPAARGAHGLRRAVLSRHATRTWRAARSSPATRACAGSIGRRSRRTGWQRLERASRLSRRSRKATFRRRRASASFIRNRCAEQGLDPLPTYTPPRESAASNPALARALSAGDALAAGAQRPQFDLRQPAGVSRDGEECRGSRFIPNDAASRGHRRWRQRARVQRSRRDVAHRTRHRQGAAWRRGRALSIWWRKLSPDGTNANMRDRPGADRHGPRGDVLRRAGRGRAGRRLTSRSHAAARRRSVVLAHQPDHDAEDLERAFRTDDRIGLVFGTQNELAALEIEALQGELVVDDGDDDIAAARRCCAFRRRPDRPRKCRRRSSSRP